MFDSAIRARSPQLVVALAVFASPLLLARAARADVFILANGGRIEAQLLNPDQSPRQTYLLKTTFGGYLTVDKRLVDRVVVKSSAERSYEAHLPSVPDTVAAHWEMAQRCRQAKLASQREFHLQQVLRLDPNHEKARHALGYSRISGRWMRQDEWKQAQGFVRHRGNWRLPQEIELENRSHEYELKIATWRKQLKVWRGWIVKGGERSRQGEHEIRSIRDPYAATVLAEMIADDKEDRQLKLMYIEVLGELSNPAAIQALTLQSLQDPDIKIREACLDELSRIRPPSATDTYIAALRHQENYMVRRAAIGLAAMNDSRATLALIEALVTEHKQLVGGGGGIQPSFSPELGSSLSMGGRPKIRKVKQQNDPVLHALSALHPGVNFGFHQQAWRNWYISKLTPPPVSLRRTE